MVGVKLIGTVSDAGFDVSSTVVKWVDALRIPIMIEIIKMVNII